MWIRRGWNSVLKINIVVYILLNNLAIKQRFPDLLEDHETEKLRTKKDECVPQSIEPIEKNLNESFMGSIGLNN